VLFFSEELKFALDNGYKIITIHHLYSFQRGDNCFLGLIEKLNDMKVEAQLNNQPTIRNIAKLLMNSMYGRFGMHTEAIQSAIINPRQLNKYSLTFKILSQIDFGQFLLIHYSLKAPDQLGKSPNYRLIREFRRGIPSRTNVAIASAVTSYSRIIINSHKLTALNQGLKIYYSDTDSLVVDGPLPSHLLDNAELGKLKLEHKIRELVERI
jgi:DNA polymerase elongation subunit (family B)